MSDEEFATPAKSAKTAKPALFHYLLTWSQADLRICSSREGFAKIVCEAFNIREEGKGEGGSVLEQWVCCVENHTSHCVHFYMALKLRMKRRFAKVRETIALRGINVHFREWVTFYYDAYTYVTKQDRNYVTSPGHPPLANSPATRKAVQGKRRDVEADSNSQEGSSSVKKSKKTPRQRLDMGDLFNIVIRNNVKNDLDLCSLSKTQLQEGKTDLNRYIMSSTEKQRGEMIRSCWKVETSHDVVARAAKTRVELLVEAKAGEHVVEDCGWLAAALQALQFNNVDVTKFADNVL